MFFELNNGRIINLDAVSKIGNNGETDLKIRYYFTTGGMMSEEFDTYEEVQDRIEELKEYNQVLSAESYNEALETAMQIQGENPEPNNEEE